MNCVYSVSFSLRLMTNGSRWDILIHSTPVQNWKMMVVPPSVWSSMNAVTVDQLLKRMLP
ncbi:hypothetical protein GLYMA_06G157700v4 [Glycine max]|uniref:Uncharacterized protein n=1 Tax=Glycine max TaxID=3847 RepID=K7KVA5_SOYBN|nr:hypothetical protein JHK87_015330 [Glycine soja]KAH1126121.1 hypothetical protein GYH30_015242 [Glycine max]KHN09650.1 hypothetical protein glysoja_011924 [Glycine soja]KRH53963.1 hypothetical protein GLYMA_06G157700v4 [Glycine max]